MNEAADPDQLMKLLKVLGPACLRVAKLVEMMNILKRSGPNQDSMLLDQRLRELLAEEGDLHEGVRRLVDENNPWKANKGGHKIR